MLLPQSVRDEEQVFEINGTLSLGYDESEGSGRHGNIVLRSREEARVDCIGLGAVGVELTPYERV